MQAFRKAIQQGIQCTSEWRIQCIRMSNARGPSEWRMHSIRVAHASGPGSISAAQALHLLLCSYKRRRTLPHRDKLYCSLFRLFSASITAKLLAPSRRYMHTAFAPRTTHL
uniref:Uncharacterized protein n=1 Tax=Dunaliella tertiolecta TaxID=3047 RepID=A0A7S3VPQ6_DUNTE